MNRPTTDDWLDALGDLARHDHHTLDAPDPELDALPPDHPRRPLDAAERDDLFAAIRAQRTAERAADETPDHTPDLPLADVAAPSPPRAPRRRAAIYGLVTLALAAVLALFVLRPAPALPPYTLEATAGAQQLRGSDQPTDTPTYTPGTRLRLVLRPATAPAAPITAALAVTGPTGPVTWSPALTVGESGAVKIEATLTGDLALAPGAYTATITLTDGEATRVVEHAFHVANSAP